MSIIGILSYGLSQSFKRQVQRCVERIDEDNAWQVRNSKNKTESSAALVRSVTLSPTRSSIDWHSVQWSPGDVVVYVR